VSGRVGGAVVEESVFGETDGYPQPEALKLRALHFKFLGAWADLSETI
jgi:hypothetical protein